jgi:hypothetical protein
MFNSKGKTLAILFFLVITAGACSFGPPSSCGEDIGGTADTALFDQYFTNMDLIDQTTGLPGQAGEDGVEFARGTVLTIQVESKTGVAVRACIQPRSGGGTTTFDQTSTLLQGQDAFDIGTIEPGSYVIRVIVDNTLVKNFPFVVK